MKSTIVAVSTLLFGAALLFTGHGLQLAVVPLAAANASFGTVAIGMLWSGYALGLMVGCLTAGRLIGRVGHIRAFAALVGALTAIMLLFPLLTDAKAWLVLRFLHGLVIAGVFVSMESWLNGKTSNAMRGVVLSSYSTLSLVMISVGQLGLGLFPVHDPRLFSLSAVFIVLAVIPVVLTRSEAPPVSAAARINIGKLWRTSRVAVIGSVLVGLAGSAFWGLGPVFASAVGLSAGEISLYLGVTIWGGASCQWLIGRLSDRFDRRKVVAAASLVAALAGLAITYEAARSFPLLLLSTFIFGASSFSLSAICVAMAHDRARGAFVETSSGLLFIFSIGSTLGSLMASTVMELIRHDALYLYTAAIHGTLALTAFAFSLARPPTPKAAKQDFRPTPQTSPEAFTMDPRGEGDDRRN